MAATTRFGEQNKEPCPNNHLTVPAINNLGNSCGTYGKGNPDSHFHGFLWSGVGTFTEFDIDGATDTIIHGINDAGNFCGTFEDGVHPSAGWVSLNGAVESFSSVDDPLFNHTAYTYDEASNKAAEVRPNGRTMTYNTYDAMNRLTQMTTQQSPTLDAVTRYSWTNRARRLPWLIQDPNWTIMITMSWGGSAS